MRRPDTTVRRVPNAEPVGKAIRGALLRALTKSNPSQWARAKGRAGGLAAMVKTNSALRHLHLSYNPIGAEGSLAVATALRGNKVLGNVAMACTGATMETAGCVSDIAREG